MGLFDKITKTLGDAINEALPTPPPLPSRRGHDSKDESAPQSTTQGDTAAASEDALFSPRLNSLIAAAVADGQLTETERRVLLRNAQSEGVAADEFEMVLEARLFEQKQILAGRQSPSATSQRPVTTPSSPARAQSKCPHCGAPVKVLASVCPECGYDYPDCAERKQTSWERLTHKLEFLDRRVKPSSNPFAQAFAYQDLYLKKVDVINNHPIPDSKREIIDFLVCCAPLSRDKFLFSDTLPQITRAYRNKAKQTIAKARIVCRDDRELMERIEEIARKYKIKA